jgi:hypothetical protein
MGEVIPIPNERATERRPIHIEFTPRAFPGNRIAARLDYNTVMDRWIVELKHVNRGYRITKSVATPYRPYEYLPWFVCYFADPSGKATEITPDNLGDDMKLFLVPGPSGKPPEDDG